MHIGPEILFGIGTLILLVAIVWGVVRNSHRNRANDAITEAATREEYKRPKSYDEGKFDAQLHTKR